MSDLPNKASGPRGQRSQGQSGRNSSGNRQRNRLGNSSSGRQRSQPGRSGNNRPSSRSTSSARQSSTPQVAETLELASPLPAFSSLGSGRLLLIFVVLVFLVAALSGLSPPGEWYETLDKPVWTPPNWLFGPAWTVLYLLIAVAGWLIFTHATSNTTRVLWGVQLALNALWSFLFFGQQLMGAALVNVVLMSAVALVLIVALLRDVYPWSRMAAVLTMPYWTWVTFAACLNASIWLRNAA